MGVSSPGIGGNEIVEELAKEGVILGHDLPVPFREGKQSCLVMRIDFESELKAANSDQKLGLLGAEKLQDLQRVNVAVFFDIQRKIVKRKKIGSCNRKNIPQSNFWECSGSGVARTGMPCRE